MARINKLKTEIKETRVPLATDEPTVTEPTVTSPCGKSTATVKAGARTVRVYTKETHGDDFKALAEQYVETHEGGWTIETA